MNRELLRQYEQTYKIGLNYGTPKILRLRFCNLEKFSQELQKPFDKIFSRCMEKTMQVLCKYIPGTKIGYTDMKEISIIIKDTHADGSEISFFNNSLTDITSNLASIATVFFAINWDDLIMEFCAENGINSTEAKLNPKKYEVLQPYFNNHLCGMFNCNYFELANSAEILDYLKIRQEDCNANSVNMIIKHYFKDHNCKTTEEKTEFLKANGIHLNSFPIKYFKGSMCYSILKDELNWHVETSVNFYNNIEFVNKLYSD